jgi:hypothetical protein
MTLQLSDERRMPGQYANVSVARRNLRFANMLLHDQAARSRYFELKAFGHFGLCGRLEFLRLLPAPSSMVPYM